MEELLNGAKSFGLIGIVLGIITQIHRIRPITLLTAHEIESKLFSKETQLLVRAIKITFETLVTAVFLVAYSLIIIQIDTTLEPLSIYVYFIYFPVIAITFFGSLFVIDLNKKTPDFISEHIQVFILLYFIFVLFLFFIPGYLIALIIGPVLVDEQTDWNVRQLSVFVSIVVFFLLLISVFLRFIVITVYKAIVIGRINNRQLYIKMEGKRWYPQYRMKEDYIILTDNKLIEMSNKFKFIERAEFLKLTLINDSQKPYQDNLECTKQAYNNYATIIDQINSAPWKAYERDIFLKHLQKENRTSLLEIGAGTGKDSLFFQQKGLKVTAIDFSEEMVRLCKEKGLSDVHCIDVREMDFPSNYFDAIYTLNCLFHIPKIEMISVLRQIRRIMRPDGLLYFGVIGGQNSEKIWKKDTFEPQRFFHSIVTKISRN